MRKTKFARRVFLEILGGGPLAARLALAGFRVLLLEAGKDVGKLPVYQVPAFHAKSTEDEQMRWDFYVKHYDDEIIASDAR